MVRAAQEAAKAGRKVKETKLTNRFDITGVGNGSQYCDYSMQLPIAVPTTEADGHDNGQATEMVFDAPVVEGTGEHLPLIWGLRSTTALKGVL